MDELQKFLFEGLPVRGLLVRLGASWRELLSRRESASDGGHAFAPPVRRLLGEMAAAGALMQANLKFNGALVLQIQGAGPLKLAVVETASDLSYRATAKLVGDVPADATLAGLANLHGKGRCAITLDPVDRLPGQQPYQGIVPLHGDHGEPLHRLSDVLEHYMLQSEQLDTRLVLAADDQIAAGLLIQRLPLAGIGNLSGSSAARDEDLIGRSEDFNRIALLAGTLQPAELLGLQPQEVLRRLFWEESVRIFEPQTPRFACRCSRERVSAMLLNLGEEEIASLVAERGLAEVGCDFCGAIYRFDAVDVGKLFTPGRDGPPSSGQLQ